MAELTNRQLNAILGAQGENNRKGIKKIIGAIARIFGALAAKNEEIFWYETTVTLAAVTGNVITGTIKIEQASDFVASKIVAHGFQAVAAGANQGQPLVNESWQLAIQDGGTDRQFQENPIHFTNGTGTAQRPYIFTKNKLFRRNSTVALRFTQLLANAVAANQRVQVALGGYKIFDEAALNLTVRR